jgi:hypothetical protein
MSYASADKKQFFHPTVTISHPTAAAGSIHRKRKMPNSNPK